MNADIKLIEKMEKITNKTHKLIPKLQNAVRAVARGGTYALWNITDKQALYLLKIGQLQESDFEVMPETSKFKKDSERKSKKNQKSEE